MNEKIRQWIKVSRIQTAFVTMLALWAGYITVSPLTVGDTVILGAIGLSIHIWGFIDNEIADAKYDRKYGDGDHPIAQGKIDPTTALIVSVFSAGVAILISAYIGGTFAMLIMLSFIPGFAYNRYSKKHWWSNIYLTIWASILVIAGSYYIGEPNDITLMITGAIAIQIFVQVMEGDMKDLAGHENTFMEKLGVSLNITSTKVINTKWAEILVSILKIGEFILTSTAAFSSLQEGFWIGLLMFVPAGGIFLFTHNLWIVKDYDRGQIKMVSSLHELSSIIFLGVCFTFMHIISGVFIMLMPVVWYIGVNNLVHSGALNPDI